MWLLVLIIIIAYIYCDRKWKSYLRENEKMWRKSLCDSLYYESKKAEANFLLKAFALLDESTGTHLVEEYVSSLDGYSVTWSQVRDLEARDYKAAIKSMAILLRGVRGSHYRSTLKGLKTRAHDIASGYFDPEVDDGGAWDLWQEVIQELEEKLKSSPNPVTEAMSRFVSAFLWLLRYILFPKRAFRRHKSKISRHTRRVK
jgi:hypothetical protein